MSVVHWKGYKMVKLSHAECDELLDFCLGQDMAFIKSYSMELIENNIMLGTEWHQGMDIKCVCSHAELIISSNRGECCSDSLFEHDAVYDCIDHAREVKYYIRDNYEMYCSFLAQWITGPNDLGMVKPISEAVYNALVVDRELVKTFNKGNKMSNNNDVAIYSIADDSYVDPVEMGDVFDGSHCRLMRIDTFKPVVIGESFTDMNGLLCQLKTATPPKGTNNLWLRVVAV